MSNLTGLLGESVREFSTFGCSSWHSLVKQWRRRRNLPEFLLKDTASETDAQSHGGRGITAGGANVGSQIGSVTDKREKLLKLVQFPQREEKASRRMNGGSQDRWRHRIRRRRRLRNHMQIESHMELTRKENYVEQMDEGMII
ncbi:unnamed protein product [Microthlaspi erraticum]|uniref:Uncharacterized protein n=1 Tax=Microthlaspi erraticum TaxID=1685480 RepID=A0A6D2KHN8_9BRAS|nr:unnamed protein product [Microthlaspi erraticum]